MCDFFIKDNKLLEKYNGISKSEAVNSLQNVYLREKSGKL